MENKAAEKKSVSLRQLAQIAPMVRGLLASPTGQPDIPFEPVILKSLTNKQAIDFAGSERNAEAATYPTPLVKGQRPPLFVDAMDVNDSPRDIRKRLGDGILGYSRQFNMKPDIVCLRNLGILYVSRPSDERRGAEATDMPLQNKVALVTGAAGAIGYGVCCGLLEKGCHLVASDLPGEKLDRFTADLKQTAGDRVIGVPIDVTDKDSVVRGFESVILTWGGIDIVVVNAGIPLVSYLKDIDLDAFRKLEEVNVEGTLLTLGEIARHFIAQGTGGDVIIVSTKNVPSPGAGFGAYSATKAACHQLGRIASIELAQYDVRVNMVAPDGVFAEGKYKSGLWAAVGPDRMRARGLDEEGLQEYYRNRNLLKIQVTGRHVANAVLFFATRQTPTTGVTIPVDGGLPDATPR
ncbi:MAG: SDR family NAD(P)-dependent oxidoreductase [Phycisphaerales bacterium]|nr:MAG: SDR family NAD(P)-dependent oxidoreductase [Phycisphaerales bacterium]